MLCLGGITGNFEIAKQTFNPNKDAFQDDIEILEISLKTAKL